MHHFWCNKRPNNTPMELPNGLSPPPLHKAVGAFTRLKGFGLAFATIALCSLRDDDQNRTGVLCMASRRTSRCATPSFNTFFFYLF